MLRKTFLVEGKMLNDSDLNTVSVRDAVMERCDDTRLVCFPRVLFKTVSAGVSVQEQLTTGGVLWFPDLTALDSTWILPISVGVINLLIVEVSGSE